MTKPDHTSLDDGALLLVTPTFASASLRPLGLAALPPFVARPVAKSGNVTHSRTSTIALP